MIAERKMQEELERHDCGRKVQEELERHDCGRKVQEELAEDEEEFAEEDVCRRAEDLPGSLRRKMM